MEKSTEKYLGRGLHSSKWNKVLDKNGKSKLKDFIEIVRKDTNLIIQIRENYFNVYYKGGNLLKVNSENSFDFDSNYYKGNPDLVNNDIERKVKRQNALKKLKEIHDYQAFIKDMENIMDDYWDWLEKRDSDNRTLHEKDTQHQLCISNTENSEYTIIDLEFQVSAKEECPYRYRKTFRPNGRYVKKEKKSPRFDIIAVRNSDHKLCVIELKSGTNAIYGKSGIGDHADSFEGSIGNNHMTSQSFLDEMKKVISDKKKLELLNDNFIVSDAEPEFIYAYAFTNDDEKMKNIEQKEFEMERKKAKCEKYNVIYLNKGDFTLSDKKH
ncbi:MAG: hypothetical protein IK025_07080 [Bacteroidales bacterium]|nr:hypothetical protein [Bacteroidales bacterium]